jgi:RimJ/RimL family protein N-acetyltransferase
MRIDGDGFYLRPAGPDDAAELVRAFAEDPHLAVDWGVDDAPTEDEARASLSRDAELWTNGEGNRFTIAAASTDAFLGGVNFHNIRPDHRRAEVGFWLAPWARGRRVGSGAVAAACQWAFTRWELTRIEMTTLPDNAGALALAEKIGFTREGLLRSRNFERGKQVDIVMLGALAGEIVSP